MAKLDFKNFKEITAELYRLRDKCGMIGDLEDGEVKEFFKHLCETDTNFLLPVFKFMEEIYTQLDICGYDVHKLSNNKDYNHKTNRERTKENLHNMLEDVVNELELSELMIEKHGQLGTNPAELVRLVLEQKDKEIHLLKKGIVKIDIKNPSKKVKCEACNGTGEISVNIGAGISLGIDTCYTCNGRGVINE